MKYLEQIYFSSQHNQHLCQLCLICYILKANSLLVYNNKTVICKQAISRKDCLAFVTQKPKHTELSKLCYLNYRK